MSSNDMVIGIIGQNLIKSKEAIKFKAYLCPAGRWTIGWGHIKGVKEGDMCDLAQAQKWFNEDVLEAQKTVNTFCRGLNQNQFDALVSFVFNIGTGNFKTSTLLKKLVLNMYDTSIAFEFKRWVYGAAENDGIDNDGDGITDEAGEKEALPGLVIRRGEEANLYFTPIA